MTTKLIALSEYRKNLSRYAREAQTHQIQYIVMVHGKPVFEVRPAQEELFLESTAYRNEQWDEFSSPEALLQDLKKHHRIKKS